MRPRVVLVPPLIMPSPGMWPLSRRLQRQGFRTLVFRYPSYRWRVEPSAELLANYLNKLSDEVVDVVTFSMGGILLRWAVNNHQIKPRLRRVVMIGPPNRGSRAADLVYNTVGEAGLRLFFGRAAPQLRHGRNGLCTRAGFLPEDTELGIIAGGKGNQRGFNYLLPGDNDRIVTVNEARLYGMKDFRVLELGHGPLIFSTKTADLCRRFLKRGSFEAETAESRPPKMHHASAN